MRTGDAQCSKMNLNVSKLKIISLPEPVTLLFCWGLLFKDSTKGCPFYKTGYQFEQGSVQSMQSASNLFFIFMMNSFKTFI